MEGHIHGQFNSDQVAIDGGNASGPAVTFSVAPVATFNPLLAWQQANSLPLDGAYPSGYLSGSADINSGNDQAVIPFVAPEATFSWVLPYSQQGISHPMSGLINGGNDPAVHPQ
jgi:hypothetical protein